MKTAELLERLETHYRKPGADRDGEILITEAAAPGGSDRRADLIRIGLWRSRGPGIDVHELKVSTADWNRELDDPAKAEAWWPYCHRFWVVAPSTDVVDPATLPHGWGLMVPARGRRFTIVVKPTRKEPKVTVALLIELCRRTDNSRLAQNDRALRDQATKLNERHRALLDQRAQQSVNADLRDRLELLDQLETALGVQLDRFPWVSGRATPAELGAAIRETAADHLAAQRARDKVLQALDGSERAYKHLRDQAKKIRADLDPTVAP